LSFPDIDKRLAFEWNFNDGIIENSTHTDGWLEYVAVFYDYAAKGYYNFV